MPRAHPEFDQASNGIRLQLPKLSEREWSRLIKCLHLSPKLARLLVALLLGKEDKWICTHLKIKRTTIQSYLHRLYEQLGVSNRSQLIVGTCLYCLRGYLKAQDTPATEPRQKERAKEQQSKGNLSIQ